MFQIMMLPDADNFLKVVEGSYGQVLLHLPDDTRCDLKRDHTARQMLRVMRPTQEGFASASPTPGTCPPFSII